MTGVQTCALPILPFDITDDQKEKKFHIGTEFIKLCCAASALFEKVGPATSPHNQFFRDIVPSKGQPDI